MGHQDAKGIYRERFCRERWFAETCWWWNDDSLRIFRKDILTHTGKIYAKLAREKTDAEYDKFKERTKNGLSPVEIHFLENFEREQKKLLGGKDSELQLHHATL